MTQIEWKGKPPQQPEPHKVTVTKQEAVKVTAPKKETLSVKVTE